MGCIPARKGKRKAPSPSPEASDSPSSEASSSRSAVEEEEAVSAENSDHDQASNIDSDSGLHNNATSDSEEEQGDDNNESASESDDDDDDARALPKLDTAKARTKLHHVAKTLRATAKKSKTFEVQKLIKKLKGLRKKASLADQAESAEKELVALKSIDTALLAGRALITKMVKAKLMPRPTRPALMCSLPGV